MATRVRQVVPSAGSLGAMWAGRLYVCDDAEAGRLEAAGHAEIVERGLPENLVLGYTAEEVPEGGMVPPPLAGAERPRSRGKKAKEVSDGDGNGAPANERAAAEDGETATDGQTATGGDGNPPAA